MHAKPTVIVSVGGGGNDPGMGKSVILPEQQGSDRSSQNAMVNSQRSPSASRKTLTALQKEEEEKISKSRPPVWVRACSYIAENKVFVGLTSALTIYALTGDDIRLLTTNQPEDDYFNALTLACLITFSIEILLSCIGKDDYFGGFFFWLDLVSTITLVLDLTWVRAAIEESSDEGSETLRSGRAARGGARLGRIVRILRLVRILKLYKNYYEAQRKKARARAKKNPDDEDWDEVDVDKNELQNTAESRVGKRFSELTTRHVIILVLTMLFVLPQFGRDMSELMPTSALYGADIVFEAFTNYTLYPLEETTRLNYERTLLEYIYYHNWYAGDCGNSLCPDFYLTHLFYVGIASKDDDELDTVSPDIRSETLAMFRLEMQNQSMLGYTYDVGEIPEDALNGLSSWERPTEELCLQGSWYRRGVSLLTSITTTGPRTVNYVVNCPEELRPNEKFRYLPVLLSEESRERLHLVFYFDQRPYVFEESMFALIITFCICLILLYASLSFSHDANTMVLNPVEKMISTVHRIRDNPLQAMSMADEEFVLEEAKKAKMRQEIESKDPLTSFKDLITCKSKQKPVEEVMETVILEKTIIKLGSLLALGFGEAGASIIEHNMHGVDSACVDAMVDGTKVEAIIGCARIRDFSTATEVLHEKVMTFVNQIAEIVHGLAGDCHGAPNKNNGDTFLIIWRTSTLLAEDQYKIARFADMAVMGFTRMLGAIHCSRVLEAYRGHPGLQQRLGRNCRVNMSFGLHMGMAIEGAVGSEFKIDASYLSPNVSIAETVERATQIYGVSILVAESVRSLCTPDMASKLRLIDKVLITGSTKPMELYCMDLDFMVLSVESPMKKQAWNSKQRFLARQQCEAEKNKNMSSEISIVGLFDEHKDIRQMRKRYTTEFTQTFNMGFQNYLLGEWQVAERLLSRTRTMLTPTNADDDTDTPIIEDGPSSALLRYMETLYQFEAPEKWEGVRELGHAALH